VELSTKLRAAERVAGAGDGVEQAAIEIADGVIFAVGIVLIAA
jgi:N-acyl-D-aspartate/D-glutamate deacylase